MSDLKKLKEEINLLKYKIKLLNTVSPLPWQYGNVRAFAIQSTNTGECFIAATIDVFQGASFDPNAQAVLSDDLTFITFTLYSSPASGANTTCITPFYKVSDLRITSITINDIPNTGLPYSSPKTPNTPGTLVYTSLPQR